MGQTIWPDNVRYAFLISGTQPARILGAFPELEISDVSAECTTLSGLVSGPTELRGLLARFDALDVTVIEMRRLPH
ncbi:hypothetical protein [Rhodococcus opacus]|uniref:hypothetical protein n=1 Tax=Rhodococcus opacus TaxID=37919 RepID=UPI0022367387|nr:hypothetical protein [Rhodococcus opacus]UZG59621.1 hypothetical protein ONE62_38230 [Rhodococcus opacus]